MKVLFVCLGNTCRSPMMERMFRHMIADAAELSHVEVTSAGLRESAAGQPMAEFSQNELRSRGINADSHTSRYIGQLNLRDYQLIVTVGQEEAETIKQLPGWGGNATLIILGGGVPNPWQQGAEAYRDCANHIESSLPRLLDLLEAR